MANRIPLIVNPTASQIQELPTNDTLDINNNIDVAGISTFTGGVIVNTLKVSDLTDNRIVISGTSGEVEDSANLTFDGSTLGVTGNATFSGKIQPSAGSGTGNGIRWAENPGGGTGDAASITYYAETGENTKLKIAVANDADDDIELATTNGAAVNISANTAATNKTTGALVVTGGVGISGALHVGDDITAFASSDRDYKDNLTPITNALDKVGILTGYTFTWNSKSLFDGQEGVGVVAQEVEALGMAGITTTRVTDGKKGVRYDRLTAILIEAIKELKKENDDLKTLIKNSSSFANLKSSL